MLKLAGAPPTIGAAVEKGASADERVQMNSSRLVVVSNTTFIQDNAVTQDQQALDFISGQRELAAQSREAYRDRTENFQTSHLHSE